MEEGREGQREGGRDGEREGIKTTTTTTTTVWWRKGERSGQEGHSPQRGREGERKGGREKSLKVRPLIMYSTGKIFPFVKCHMIMKILSAIQFS